MMKPLRIALAGATGRMGRMITHAIADIIADTIDESHSVVLVAATTNPASPLLIGADSGELNGLGKNGVVIESHPEALVAHDPDVIIDFTTPEASVIHAELAAAAGIPMVLATTGHDKAQAQKIKKIAQKIPLVWCANTSVGVTLLADLVTQVARSLESSDWDIEIIETHHRHKADAPSGTGLMLGEAAAKGRDTPLDSLAVLGRTTDDGTRATGSIGFAAIRGGDVAGEHRVIFYGMGEQVELTHRATDRGIFARGALRAAAWVIGKKPGLYSMQSVLK